MNHCHTQNEFMESRGKSRMPLKPNQVFVGQGPTKVRPPIRNYTALPHCSAMWTYSLTKIRNDYLNVSTPAVSSRFCQFKFFFFQSSMTFVGYFNRYYENPSNDSKGNHHKYTCRLTKIKSIIFWTCPKLFKIPNQARIQNTSDGKMSDSNAIKETVGYV